VLERSSDEAGFLPNGYFVRVVHESPVNWEGVAFAMMMMMMTTSLEYRSPDSSCRRNGEDSDASQDPSKDVVVSSLTALWM
jgi:hypothetical protein